MSDPSPPPVAVDCLCGTRWTGQRLASPQVIPCGGCGRQLFVFGLGPWVPAKLASPVMAAPPARLRPKDWLNLALALAFTLLLLGASMLLFFAGSKTDPTPVDRGPSLRQSLVQAKKWLGEGEFSRAAKALAAMSDLTPEEWLATEEIADWRQAKAEASLLADLLGEPLEDLIQHAASGSEEEWNEAFARRYQGKSVLLDAEFEPVGAGWKIDYSFPPPEKALLTLEGLKFLDHVPQKTKQRLILGARLASIQVEAGGPTWIIRFAPDSGVLLTNAAAAAHACPPLAEEDAKAVLKQQAEWLRPR